VRRRGLLAALGTAGALLLAACGAEGTGTGVNAIEPYEGRSGLHLTGTVDGRQFAVNDGAPVLRLADCDVNDGPDTDLCFISRQVDGGFVAIVIENPGVIAEGSFDVVAPACQSPNCDDVTEGLIVELQQAPGADRTRAIGGRVQFDRVEDGARYGGNLNLQLPKGRISGTFEVVPRPED
jgi:hypothetical protein